MEMREQAPMAASASAAESKEEWEIQSEQFKRQGIVQQLYLFAFRLT
jgi:hypothetical protein